MKHARRRWLLAIFLFGLGVSSLLVARGRVAGDQLNFLALGWRLAFASDWVQHGNPTSAGLFTPGGVSAVVAGLPMLLWAHHRAVALLVLATHLLAYLVLDRLLRRILEPEERLLFALLYWLSPWRLYHSGFVWNPNFLFLTGALHLWTAWRLRSRPSFWPSFAHVLLLGLSLQLAVHTLPLAVASLLLWWRRYLKLHLGGALAGAAMVAASLVPWALHAAAHGMRVPGLEHDLAPDLMVVNTALRAAGYWLRYSSLALSEEIFCLDFGGVVGAAAMARLAPALALAKGLLYWLSLPAALWANYRLWKGSGRWWRRPMEAAATEREWLIGVVRWSLAATLLTFALVPSTVMRWYLNGLFHLAVLPLVLAAGEALRGEQGRRAWRAVAIYGALSAAVGLALVWGAPMYRCGGEHCVSSTVLPPLAADYPMLDDLEIRGTCPMVVNDPEGWHVQTLPRPDSHR